MAKKYSETQWKADLTRALRESAGKILSLHGHAMQAAGWPDLYIAHKIWSGWLELKIDAPVTDIQKLCINDLRARGVPCWVLMWPGRGPEIYITNEVGDVAAQMPATVSVLDLLRSLRDDTRG